MDQIETKTAGDTPEAVQAVREAVTGFAQDFKGFQAEITTKLNEYV